MSSMMKCTAENLTVLLCWLANDTHTQIYLAYFFAMLVQRREELFFLICVSDQDRFSFFLDRHGMMKEQRFNRLNQILSLYKKWRRQLCK